MSNEGITTEQHPVNMQNKIQPKSKQEPLISIQDRGKIKKPLWHNPEFCMLEAICIKA